MQSVDSSWQSSRMAKPRVRPSVYRTFWSFAVERHRIFEARLSADWIPETADPILKRHRFCNVFRAADRVSQHLIQTAAYGADDLLEEDLFFRVVLHRLFCRPSTWDLLEGGIGDLRAETFSVERYGRILDEALERGDRLYTGAYILCATPAYGHARKHWNHLMLLDAMLKDGVAGRIASAPSLHAVYQELRSWPLLGPFMAYQLAIDLNYSPLISFSENDFTMPGPGTLRGIRKVFTDIGSRAPSDVVFWLVDQQDEVRDDLGLTPPTLFGRKLHAIDCQNLLCEVDKYCRAAYPRLLSNRSAIKQRYVHDPTRFRFMFPPDWQLEEPIPDQWRVRVGDPAFV